MTGQPTAAEVLAAHWPWPSAGGFACDETDCDGWGADSQAFAQHQADMLAAAGLLVTPRAERTPPEGAIRAAWIAAHPFYATTSIEQREAEFDAWLARHDTQVAARALREAADAHGASLDRRGRRYLYAHADSIARGEGS